jgi:D-alanyl-D-alanine carboxypeptidase/D-alanyl-D-alanine-endopeptidase (penicillin-binding protein 4)
METSGEKQKVVVRGIVPGDREPLTVWKKIENPPLYFAHTLKRMLAERGIKVRGRARVGTVSSHAMALYVAQSESLDLILKKLNKVSSNFIAEQLVKTLGAEARGVPGTFANGIDVVEEFLEREVGIQRGSYVMRNGSGLNDTNRFSAVQINRLLRFMYEKFPLAPEFLSSLGIAGKDGTLRYRFEGSDAVGRLRGKTGTLENVSALSGYVQSMGGERFAFAMMVNDYTGRSAQIVQGLDALGVAVAASGTLQGPSRAAAAMITQESVQGPLDEASSRIRTYLSLGKQADRRNTPFLRTALRTEKDPAVRAVVAESLYQSNPDDYVAARILLDSFAANEAVYGRLRKIALLLDIEVPGFPSVVELAAQGNSDALSRLIELGSAAAGDEAAQKDVSEGLAEVSRTAPDELLAALRSAESAERDTATTLLAKGLTKAADPEHPFWPALRKMNGSVDERAASFAKELEVAMSRKMAAEKVPVIQPAAVNESKSPEPQSSPRPAIRPGG